jgi:hypothetical protein
MPAPRRAAPSVASRGRRPATVRWPRSGTVLLVSPTCLAVGRRLRFRHRRCGAHRPTCGTSEMSSVPGRSACTASEAPRTRRGPASIPTSSPGLGGTTHFRRRRGRGRWHGRSTPWCSASKRSRTTRPSSIRSGGAARWQTRCAGWHTRRCTMNSTSVEGSSSGDPRSARGQEGTAASAARGVLFRGAEGHSKRARLSGSANRFANTRAYGGGVRQLHDQVTVDLCPIGPPHDDGVRAAPQPLQRWAVLRQDLEAVPAARLVHDHTADGRARSTCVVSHATSLRTSRPVSQDHPRWARRRGPGPTVPTRAFRARRRTVSVATEGSVVW